MKQSNKKPNAASTPKSNLPAQPVSTPAETTSGLPELFTDGIKDMYWAENHLVKSLPKMIAAAGSSDLQTALADHLEVTKQHAARLEGVFELLGVKIQAKKCDACEGLVMSGEHIIESTEPGSPARDTGLIMASLKVENFEITSYNGLIQLAATLGKNDVAEILRQNLADEMEADQLLTELSQKRPTSNNTAAGNGTPVKKMLRKK